MKFVDSIFQTGFVKVFHSKIHTNYFSNKDKEMKPFVNCLHPFGNSLSTFKNAI